MIIESSSDDDMRVEPSCEKSKELILAVLLQNSLATLKFAILEFISFMVISIFVAALAVSIMDK